MIGMSSNHIKTITLTILYTIYNKQNNTSKCAILIILSWTSGYTYNFAAKLLQKSIRSTMLGRTYKVSYWCLMSYTVALTEEELSTGMMHSHTLQKAKHAFCVHGFLKIEMLFSKTFLATIAAAYAKQLTYREEELEQGTKTSHRRYIVPIALQGPFHDPQLYANPILLQLMHALLGKHLLFSSLGAISALPGCMDQHLHADFYALFEEELAISCATPPFAITVAVPLLDIDPLNGPTHIWSGSHLTYPIDQRMESYEKHLLYGSMGSCYMWDYRTFHAGGSNHSSEIRSLLYMSYTRRWFQDLANPDRLSIPQKEFEEIPEEYKALFAKAKPVLCR